MCADTSRVLPPLGPWAVAQAGDAPKAAELPWPHIDRSLERLKAHNSQLGTAP